MSLLSSLGRRRSAFRRATAQAPAQRQRNSRAALELLEGRTLFSSYNASTVTQLINAINSANASAEADTITLAAGKTFTLTEPQESGNEFFAYGSTGLPGITGSGALTIIGNGATIEATGGCRLIRVAEGASLTLSDLTLQGGRNLFSVRPVKGGAIRNDGTLTLHRVIVQNNTVIAMDFNSGPDGMGGGVYSSGLLTITDSIFRNNSVYGGPGRDAGFTFGEPGVGGRAVPAGAGGNGLGGGLCVDGGIATITNSTFTGNIAQGVAGGDGAIDSYNAGADGGNGHGGGVFIADASVTLRQVSITSNTALGGLGGVGVLKGQDGRSGRGFGGGLFNRTASVQLDSFTKTHILDNIG